MDRVADAHLWVALWNDQKDFAFVGADQNWGIVFRVLRVDRHLLIDRQPFHAVGSFLLGGEASLLETKQNFLFREKKFSPSKASITILPQINPCSLVYRKT